MHNIGPDIDEHEVGTFSIRTSVQAIACPEGAVVTDKDGNQLASYPDKCHVVIDGDQRFIVADYVFSGLFTETDPAETAVTTSADATAQQTTAAAVAGQPVEPTHDDLVGGLRELDPQKRAAIRAALDEVDPQLDQPAGPAATDTTTTAATVGTTTPPFTSAGGGTTEPAPAAQSDAGTAGSGGSASPGNDATTTTPGQ